MGYFELSSFQRTAAIVGCAGANARLTQRVPVMRTVEFSMFMVCFLYDGHHIFEEY
jgi:hypothetical protein